MSEDTNIGQNDVEGTTEAVPTSEQPAEQTEQTDDLPEDVSERTRLQFEKLKAANKELAERLASKEQPQPQFSSVLDELNPRTPVPSALQPDQVADITKGLLDRDGYIDPDLLNKTLHDAEERARRAEAKAEEASKRIEKFEESQIVSKVHGAYPELDPYSPKFNSRFYELTKNEMIGQLMQGKQDYAAAAKKVSDLLKKEKASETQKVETQKVISQREQAAATTGAVKPSAGEYERLQQGARAGDSLSIGQLLDANGY